MYLYLREAYSPLWGFLYGWTLFTVIQTGTIAAVAVAFARFLGVLAPSISESRYLFAPLHLIRSLRDYAFDCPVGCPAGDRSADRDEYAGHRVWQDHPELVYRRQARRAGRADSARTYRGLECLRPCTRTWLPSGSGRLSSFRQRPHRLLSLVVVFCVSQIGVAFLRGFVARHYLCRGRGQGSTDDASPLTGYRHGDRYADLPGREHRLPGCAELPRYPTCSA